MWMGWCTLPPEGELTGLYVGNNRGSDPTPSFDHSVACFHDFGREFVIIIRYALSTMWKHTMAEDCLYVVTT